MLKLYCRASERSPFEGSCCGKGYTTVDSLPPSPTESGDIPPPPRYYYPFFLFSFVKPICIEPHTAIDISLYLPFHLCVCLLILYRRYRVVLFGDAGTGKTALVSQFMTSEYMHTYDASLGKFKEWPAFTFFFLFKFSVWSFFSTFVHIVNKHLC